MGVLRKIKAVIHPVKGTLLFPDDVVKDAQKGEIEYTPPHLEPPEPKIGGYKSPSGAIYYSDGTAVDAAVAIQERPSNPPIVSEKGGKAETLRDLVLSKWRRLS